MCIRRNRESYISHSLRTPLSSRRQITISSFRAAWMASLYQPHAAVLLTSASHWRRRCPSAAERLAVEDVSDSFHVGQTDPGRTR